MKTAKEISTLFIDHNAASRNFRNTARYRKFILFFGIMLMISAIPILITETILEDGHPQDETLNMVNHLVPSAVALLGLFILLSTFLICEHANVDNCLQPINARMFKLHHCVFPNPKEEGYARLSQDL